MNRDSGVPAVVLAGAPMDSDLQAEYPLKFRAEIAVAGKPMLQHVIDALRASSHVTNIRVVGEIQCEGSEETIPSAGGLMENLAAGLEASEEDRILVVTSDIPMLTPEAVDDFLIRCGDFSADFYYPIIPKEACEDRFPGMRRTCVRLAEGTFTGGNLMLVNRRFLLENMDGIREAIAARKSVFQLARLVGFSVLVRMIIAQLILPGALRLDLLERTVGRILKGNMRAVRTPFPEIGSDVDNLEQIRHAEAYLSGMGNRGV